MKKEYDQAIEKFKKSIEMDNQNVAAYYNLGNAYLLIDRKRDAIEAFEQTLKLDPDNIEWKLMVAGIYYDQKDYENTLKHTSDTLKKDPNSIEAMMMQGKNGVYKSFVRSILIILMDQILNT